MISQQQPPSIVYDILSLMNSTFLAAYMILCCMKKLVPNSWFSFPFPKKNVYFLDDSVPPLPIWPPVLPLTVTYILRFPLSTKSHIYFLLVMSFIHRIHLGLRLLENFCNKLISHGDMLLPPRDWNLECDSYKGKCLKAFRNKMHYLLPNVIQKFS
jgi:hypothetical protein